MSKRFQGLKIAIFLLTPVLVLLFIGLVMFRQSLVLKRAEPSKSDWEKFQDKVEELKKENWQLKEETPFKFYYQKEDDLQKVGSSLFSALSVVERALSRRFDRSLKIFLLEPKKAEEILDGEKSYVSLKKDPFALLSVDFSREDMDLFAARLVCYSLSDVDDSYWFREGLARYFAYEVINGNREAFSLSKSSSYFDWQELEETKDIFTLSEEEREAFCQQSASILSYVFERVGREKLPLMVDSLSAGSSGKATISYLTGESIVEIEKQWREKFLSGEKSRAEEKGDRGRELSRLALSFYLITLAAILLGSILTYYLNYRWRN